MVICSTHNTILDDAALGDGPEKSICELRELVSFVQRERDVISVKLEVARSENARFASENTHLRSLLDQERARFVAELDRSASRLSSESKHRDIMEKIEQNNILSESNAILRMRLGESEKKAASLTDSIRNITQECQKLKG